MGRDLEKANEELEKEQKALKNIGATEEEINRIIELAETNIPEITDWSTTGVSSWKESYNTNLQSTIKEVKDCLKKAKKGDKSCIKKAKQQSQDVIASANNALTKAENTLEDKGISIAGSGFLGLAALIVVLVLLLKQLEEY